jgi:hypothetical protein
MEYIGAIMAALVGALPIAIILYVERVNGEWL